MPPEFRATPLPASKRSPDSVRLIFVTGNPGKLREAQQVLGPHIELEQDTGGYPEIQTARLEEVARAGLDFIAKRRNPPYFLEDAGLFIDALGGFPGVYSAYVYKTIGYHGILRLLQDTPDRERTARFQAVIAYRDGDGEDHVFTGTCEGWIRPQEQGTGGFGFDPVFTPRSHAEGPDGPSFAELSAEKKNEVSHRGAALRGFRDHLVTGTHEGPGTSRSSG